MIRKFKKKNLEQICSRGLIGFYADARLFTSSSSYLLAQSITEQKMSALIGADFFAWKPQCVSISSSEERNAFRLANAADYFYLAEFQLIK